jgi:hypothetical protein
MATARMTRRPFAKDGYHYTASILTGATGDSVIIPPIGKDTNITCTLIVGVGTGKFQLTTLIQLQK